MKEQLITIAGETRPVTLSRQGNVIRATVDGEEVELREVERTESALILEVDGKRIPVPWTATRDEVHFGLMGMFWRARTEKRGRRGAKEGDHSLAAPMPGSVLSIRVSTGQTVAKGDTLIVLEAMKMEHQIIAPYDGTVESISCTEGEMVQPGVDLISIEPAAETDPE